MAVVRAPWAGGRTKITEIANYLRFARAIYALDEMSVARPDRQSGTNALWQQGGREGCRAERAGEERLARQVAVPYPYFDETLFCER